MVHVAYQPRKQGLMFTFVGVAVMKPKLNSHTAKSKLTHSFAHHAILSYWERLTITIEARRHSVFKTHETIKLINQ